MPTKNTTHKTNVKKTPAKKAPAKKAAPKAAKVEKQAQSTAPRHPKARLVALTTKDSGKSGGKEALAKTLAASLAREDEDTGVIAERLRTASNSQLLRLHSAVETMKSKYGSRDKLVAAVAGTQSKDKDYTAKLDKLSLPNLLELAKSAERRARAQS